MKTKSLINFQFVDGEVSMHVTVTEYLGGPIAMYRVSHSNSMRNKGYKVDSVHDKNEAVKLGKALRAECYADMASFLQQVM